MHVTLVSGVDLSAPAASGTRSYVMGLAERLPRHGVPVTLITGGAPSVSLPGVACHPVPSRGSSLRFLLGLGASVPDLPIPRGSIVHVQRPDDLVALGLGGRRHPKLCTLHGIPARGIHRRRGALSGLLYGVLERRGLMTADRVIAVSEDTARWYRERYTWVGGKMETIPVGIDTNRFRPMDREDARRQFHVAAKYAILFAGRLTVEKRVGAVLRALPNDGSAELLVAGTGREEAKIRGLASDRPVRFLGAVPHNRMPLLMNAADILVLPSEYEGLPTVALEALACGTPVISTSVGALPEIVEPRGTGWLIGDLDSLGSVIADALPLAGALRGRCVDAAKPFSWDAVLGKILDLYGRMTPS